MSKVNVVGDAVVVTSSMRMEDLIKIQKYRENALVLTDEENEPVFVVGVKPEGAGSINRYGVVFASATRDEEKLAQVTLTYPDMPEDAKAYVSDKLGRAILNLNKIEETLPSVLEEVNAEEENILSSITVQ